MNRLMDIATNQTRKHNPKEDWLTSGVHGLKASSSSIKHKLYVYEHSALILLTDLFIYSLSHNASVHPFITHTELVHSCAVECPDN